MLAPRLRWPSFIGAAGLAVIIAAAMMFDEFTTFPGIAALAPALGTAAVIASGFQASGPAYWLLSTPLFRKIGDWSYSWYLWHWPLLAFGAILSPDISLGWRLVLAGLSLVLAAITYALIEQPVRQWKWLQGRSVIALAGGAGLACITIAGAFTLAGAARAAEADPRLMKFVAAEAQMNADRDGCVADFLTVTASPCRFGEDSTRRPVVLFGDSHAAQWYAPLKSVTARNRSPFLVFTKSSCPSVDVRGIYSTRLRRQYRECDAWRASAEEQILRLRPSIVVLTNFSEAYASWAGRPDRSEAFNRDRWSAALRATVLRLKSSGHEVVLIRDTPAAGFKVPACLARSLSRPGWWPESCSVVRTKALAETAWQREKATVTNLAVHVIDLSSAFCGPVNCEPVKQGVVVFRDDNHVTDAAAARLAPDLDMILRGVHR